VTHTPTQTTTTAAPPVIERPTPTRRQIGRSVPRIEGRAKVSGRAEYIHNFQLPGMLHGKILRSTIPHGRIRGIDTSAAQALDGVYAVITGADVQKVMPDPYYGPAFHDQPVLAMDKVRYVGEPVATVLASDPQTAEAALDLIDVDYEELPAVFDEQEAAAAGAPVLHDTIRPASMFVDLKHLDARSGTNVGMEYRLRSGDVDEGFAQADHIFEDTFRTQQTMHTPLEPIVTAGELSGTDSLVLHTASQSPSFVRAEVARLLRWPENRVRVRTAYLGGGFGAKLYIKLEALVAACVLLARRPVKISLTMEEQFYTITKHPTTTRIRTGVACDGRIVARQVETWWNGGAYADIGPRVTQKSGFTAGGPYDIPHVRLDSYAVYTNRPPAGALRGFGIPQLVWPYESHADMIARSLGMDPLAFRRLNLLRNGRPHATGTLMRDTGLSEVLDALEQHMDWQAPFDQGHGTRRRGRGIALGLKASVTPTTSVAIVNLYSDGSCGVYCGTVDMGQGSDTVMAQIAAEVLGLEAEDILVIHPDTDVTPYDMATLGSRSTFHMGKAVKSAAENVRAQVLTTAAGILETDVGELVVQQGKVIAPGGQELPLSEVLVARFGMQAGNIIGTGSFKPPYIPPDHDTGQSEQITPFWMAAATGVEVEVDTETGQVTVNRLVNVADVGTALNPSIAARQLSGAALMQLSFTLSENMQLEHGQVVNASLADYKIPGMLDLPERVTNHLVEVPHSEGPFGAKGVGESGTFGVSPAVANAVFDAVGVRIRELPLTSEVIFRALRAAQGAPLGDDQ
jgi:CO/xanthine dehydrogenase Mo-binding subunit